MAASENTVTVTDENFASVIADAQGLALVDFWATWCGPCRVLAPIVNELANEYAGQVVVGKLDVDDNPSTPEQFGVSSLPTVLFFKQGKVVDEVIGAVPRRVLEQMIAEHS